MELLHPQSKRAVTLSAEDVPVSFEPSSIRELEISLFDLLREVPYLKNAISSSCEASDALTVELDGLLWQGTLGRAALEYAFENRLLCTPYLVQELARVTKLLNIKPLNDTRATIQAFIEATEGEVIESELYDVDRVITEFHACAFSGLRTSDVENLGETLIEELLARNAKSNALLELLGSAEASGLTTLVLTSSLEKLTQAALKAAQISVSNIYGMQVRVSEEGRLLPDVLAPSCYEAGKVLRLERERHEERPLLACGNLCKRDIEMLKFAHVAVLIDPTVDETEILDFARLHPVLIVKTS